MTAVQMQGLDIPEVDDPMETDADRRVGQAEDIDIDLDLTGEQQQEQEDEYMSEDVAAFNEQAPGDHRVNNQYNDDEMADDGYQEEAGVDATSVQDEDLEDAEFADPLVDEDEILDIVDGQESSILQDPEAPQHQQHINEESNDQSQGIAVASAGQEEVADPAQQQKSIKFENTNNQSQASQGLPTDHEQDHLTDLNTDSHALQKKNIQDLDLESSADLHPDGQRQYISPEHAASVLATQALPHNIDHTSNKSSHVNGTQAEVVMSNDIGVLATTEASKIHLEEQYLPSEELEAEVREFAGSTNEEDDEQSKTTAYVHPVVIIYKDSEYSLFPPVHEDQHSEYVLDSEELAGESITNLLGACRSILAGDIQEQDELVFWIDDLGLQISEVGHPATPHSQSVS